MSKQEEISKGVEKTIKLCISQGFNATEITREVLSYEAKNNVKIWDGDVGEVELEGGCFDQVSEDYKGIIAYIKPLIEEGV